MMRHMTSDGRRSAPRNEKELTYRSVPASMRSTPSTVDEKTRSVDWTLATEESVMVYDWSRGIVPEVLLMKGLRTIPGKVPLLDAHSRWSAADVLGSAREIAVEGEKLKGRVVFSSVEKADNAWNLVREGHLTDGSIGYRVEDYTWVNEGESAKIAGRTFKGPVKVVTAWTLREFSLTPIGADEQAKARSEHKIIHEPNKREAPMKTKLMKYLQANHGLRADANDDQAWDCFRALPEAQQDAALRASAAEPAAPAAPGEPARAASDPEPLTPAQRTALISDARAATDSERERIRREETHRVNEIRGMAIRFNIPQATADKWVDESVALDTARAAAMDIIAAAQSAATGRAVVVTADERDKHRSAVATGLMIRTGLMPRAADTVGGVEFAGMTLREVAADCLRISGMSARGMDPQELFKRALSTSDFANILGDVTNKAVLVGFEDEPETFEKWVDTSGTLNDFKAHNFARVGEFPSLEEVNPDGGEYKYGKQSDTKETVTALNYGKLIKFTWMLMVNDDLGQLTETSQKMGRAVRRKQGDLVYSVLTANAAMGDGVALFHTATHKNLASSGAVPSNTTLSAAMTAMATQKDLDGLQTLNIRPQFILAPYALFATIQGLLANITPAQASNVNLFTFLEPVYDARLDTNSATAYYLAAQKSKTVKLFSLGGQLTPFIDQRVGFEIDGLEWKVRWTGAAKAMDFRGLFKNPGA